MRVTWISFAFALLVLGSPWSASASPAGGACDPFTDLGSGLAGTSGVPLFEGSGPLYAGTPFGLALSNAAPSALAALVVGTTAVNVPFRGGTLVPSPDSLLVALTDASGGLSFGGTLPANLPGGSSFYMQFWIDDAAGPLGASASNALVATTLAPLFDEMSASFDAKLATAGLPATAKPIYSSQDFVNQIFVRNPAGWAAGLDLTGISPWNQAYAQLRAGTLVSPRHVIFAEHYRLSTTPGSNEIVFVTAQNVTITRRLVATAFPIGDVGVGVLDADVPPEISFYKVLPQDWRDYLLRTADLPMLHLDQEEKALVRDMGNLPVGSGRMSHRAPFDPVRLQYSETLVGGDSGNPAFVLFGTEPVVVLTHFTANMGPFYTKHAALVNQAMSQLGGGYQLTEIDLANCVDW